MHCKKEKKLYTSINWSLVKIFGPQSKKWPWQETSYNKSTNTHNTRVSFWIWSNNFFPIYDPSNFHCKIFVQLWYLHSCILLNVHEKKKTVILDLPAMNQKLRRLQTYIPLLIHIPCNLNVLILYTHSFFVANIYTMHLSYL